MNYLSQALARWDPQPPLRENLARLGYRLPEDYLKIFAQKVGVPPAELDVYWRELAREYITSIGTTESNTRKFTLDTSYRSPLLDQYAKESEKIAPLHSTRVLHPKVQREEDLCLSSASFFRQEIVEMIHEAFSTEVKVAGVSEPNFVPQIVDGLELFHGLGESVGGVVKGRRVVFSYEKGVSMTVLPLGIDNEECGYADCDFVLTHRSERGFRWILRMGTIVPGMSYYSLYRNNAERSYGLKALLQAAKVVGQSFDNVF